MRETGTKRSEIWITTKLWNSDHGYDATIRACNNSLSKLGMKYIDLYLIHSPGNGQLIETWDALVQLQKEGKVRSIGVSNYNIDHIAVLEEHGRPLPTVNQIEMHPLIYNDRRRLLDYCKGKGILTQAYGSILSGQSNQLRNPMLLAIAQKYAKSTAQVLLRWGYEHGFQIIPKSVHKERLQQNKDIFDFELSPEDMVALNGVAPTSLGEYWNPLSQ